MTYVSFQLATSLRCGIRVSKVLDGNLEGLIGRDDRVVLNPGGANSMRLRIEVGDPSSNLDLSLQANLRQKLPGCGPFTGKVSRKAKAVFARLTLGQLDQHARQ